MTVRATIQILGLAFVMLVSTGSWNPAAASPAGNPPAASANPYLCEGEFYSQKLNGTYSTPAYDYKPSASNKNTIHIGSNSSSIRYGVGDTVLYAINFTRVYNVAKLQIRYADAVPGNTINVYLDGALRGTITTQNTGGWGSFVWHPTIVSLGNIGMGTHVVSFMVTAGGSYGMSLDMFKITGL
jgi:hypothetical protein